ncbi:tetratricopeptide repeat protein [Corynebacterium sp. LK2510]|uniref:tetratricopeptide repeat protein n=1 Tax=Corynebacterium sp. LK2510 TaxID=3110472 RepID=UPI0034CDEA46
MANFGSGAFDLSALNQTEPANGTGGGEFQAFITATQDNLEAEVLRMSAKIPVILLVGSSASGESEQLKATFTELSAGQRSFRVAYVDVDKHPMLPQMLGVQQVPTTLALAAGRPVASFPGVQPREQLAQWVSALVSQVGPQLEGLGGAEGADESEAQDPRLEQASELLNAGDFDGATAVYDEILAQDPSNAEVKQAKATVAVLKRLDPQNRTTDPLAEADAAPADVDKQLDAADAEVVAGAPERAFDRLLALVKAEPRAKERLLELFTLFEPADPRVIEARTKLASALF